MSKLLIDANSIVTACLRAGKDPDGFKVEGKQINTWEYGYNNFLGSYRKTLDMFELVPMNTIAVFDAPGSRIRRQKIHEGYKAHRPKSPDEYYEQFNTLMATVKQFIKELGGTCVSAAATEGDDVIAHLVPKLEDPIVWTRDKDMLEFGTVIYLDGDTIIGPDCADRYLGIKRRHVRLYRTLVGDTGDFGSGTSAKGFGEKAFIDLWGKFGDDGLDMMVELIEGKRIKELAEDVGELKALQKIIDSEEMVYITWLLAGWLPVKDHELKWDPGFARLKKDAGTYDPEFDEYYGTEELVTADNFDNVVADVKALLPETPYVSLDIESDVPPESVKWLETIKENASNKGKPPIGVDVHESKLAGLSITIGNNLNRTYYFSVDHAETANVESEQVKELMQYIAGEEKYFLAHNAAGFEIPVLKLNWDWWIPNMLCTMIAARYVDENEMVGLKPLATRYYRYKQQSYADVTKGRGMSECTGEEILSYGCDDTIIAGHLYNFFELVMDVEGSYDAYYDVELDSQYMTASAFVEGMTCDVAVIKDLQEKDFKEAEKAYAIIEEYLIAAEWPGALFTPLESLDAAEIKRGFYMLTGEALTTRFRILEKVAAAVAKGGEIDYADLLLDEDLGAINQYLSDNFSPRVEFKPNSWKQKAKLMYSIMALPIRYRQKVTDTQRAAGQQEGNPMTDEDCIKWALTDVDTDSEEAVVLKAILRFMNYRTRDGLYYRPYPHLIHWKTGKLHPSLKQSATSSRRFAPAGPNVNQLPKRSEEGRKVRAAIKPHHDDAVIISPDFSGQELRVGAHATGDENSIACFVGEDLKDQHTLTAFGICQKQGNEFESYEEMAAAIEAPANSKHKLAKEYRGQKAKSTNFNTNYASPGGGHYTVGKKLQVSEDVAKDFVKAKSDTFPGIDEWKVNYGALIRKQGYAETFLGVRRHTAKLFKQEGESAHIMRSALNFRIQSSSAEMTKLVMARIWRAGLLERYDAKFYMPVHDELTFSVAKCDLAAFCTELKPLMVAPYADMTVPIVSSLGVGYNFASLEDIEWDGCEEWLAKEEKLKEAA